MQHYLVWFTLLTFFIDIVYGWSYLIQPRLYFGHLEPRILNFESPPMILVFPCNILGWIVAQSIEITKTRQMYSNEWYHMILTFILSLSLWKKTIYNVFQHKKKPMNKNFNSFNRFIEKWDIVFMLPLIVSSTSLHMAL